MDGLITRPTMPLYRGKENGSKRLLDIMASGAGILVLLPVLLILALCVVVGSGWPAVFRQRRVGWRGREFTLYKFRTMTVRKAAEMGSFDAGNQSRVTGVGRFLRKTKLDELPQLWNVLRGDMSLVGPRPEVRKWVEVYPERWAVIHEVRPGITDPASLEFRDEEDRLAASADPEKAYRDEILPRKLDLYEHYVRTRTLWGDVKIIIQTILTLVIR